MISTCPWTRTDDTRITRALPTLEYLLERGGRLVVISHLGRPKGEVVPSMSLSPVAKHLQELLSYPVSFTPHLVGHGPGHGEG
ncbi:phosphoglycerate kinase, partial [Gemmatimonadota bacterium]